MNKFTYREAYNLVNVIDHDHKINGHYKNAHLALIEVSDALISVGSYLDYENISEMFYNEPKWCNTKHYHWLIIRHKDFKVLVRNYAHRHITLFFFKETYSKSNYLNGTYPIDFCKFYIDASLIPDDTDIFEEEWNYLAPVLNEAINRYIVDKLYTVWAVPQENWIKAKSIYTKGNIDDLVGLGNCLQEISMFQADIYADILLYRICKRNVGIKFKIPLNGKKEDFLVGIEERDEKIVFPVIYKNGETGCKDINYIINWFFEPVYNILTKKDKK